MYVKICGITRLEDAVGAVTLGANMLGFNFFPSSRRYITPQACARIMQGLADAGKTAVTVGIFVNSSPVEVTQIMETCGLDLAQLCGDDPPQSLQLLNGRAFKAIRPRSDLDAADLVQQYAHYSQKPAFLIDAYHPGAYGGTGQTGDWRLAARFSQEYSLMLAGGLTPDNVETAVFQVNPWGVDVASGVESKPGIKDVEKMRAFIGRAKGAGNRQ